MVSLIPSRNIQALHKRFFYRRTENGGLIALTACIPVTAAVIVAEI
jgi:hypothetical protein